MQHHNSTLFKLIYTSFETRKRMSTIHELKNFLKLSKEQIGDYLFNQYLSNFMMNRIDLDMLLILWLHYVNHIFQ